MMLEDRESASVSSMEIVTQVVDQREKIRPAGWSCCWSERKFALRVQNGQILLILCVLGEFCTGWGLGVRVCCVEWCQV